ncbi:AAA family ATPase [Thermodesulfobacteriota bacterium]
MYSRFFGFQEGPFKLVPNPAYLFLSKSHEEVLAHLTYAVRHGDGFVEVTGEVGTGKTTLCRVFVENLDPATEAAYVFNPKLDAVQLLQTINSEFGIDATADTCKDLIDTLNVFLMSQRASDRKVMLIIDEAQNLKTEVLEQLRLLSNLETTQDKLLQIILVGQPELSEMLDSYELRQLRQRISLSCRLMPLNKTETRAYIRHRIQIASRKSDDLFSSAAVRAIHRYSGGIPRLINIVCDRALLTAYGRNCRKITGRIARAAIKELARRGKQKLSYRWLTAILPIAAAGLAIIGVFLYPGTANIDGGRLPEQPEIASLPAVEPPAASPRPPLSETAAPVETDTTPLTDSWALARPEAPIEEAVSTAASETITQKATTVDSLHDFLAQLDGLASRRTAAQTLLDLWDQRDPISAYLDRLEDEGEFFNRVAQQSGLQYYRITGDFELIKKLNLPAILVFNLPGRPERGYLTLREIIDQDVVLSSGDKTLIVADPVLMETYNTHVAYVYWKNFRALEGVIPLASSGGTIMALKMMLKDTGFDEIQVNERYDRKTQQAVRSVQTRHGLKADGYVGPLTKIILYNENEKLPIPHLARGD